MSKQSIPALAGFSLQLRSFMSSAKTSSVVSLVSGDVLRFTVSEETLAIKMVKHFDKQHVMLVDAKQHNLQQYLVNNDKEMEVIYNILIYMKPGTNSLFLRDKAFKTSFNLTSSLTPGRR